MGQTNCGPRGIGGVSQPFRLQDWDIPAQPAETVAEIAERHSWIAYQMERAWQFADELASRLRDRKRFYRKRLAAELGAVLGKTIGRPIDLNAFLKAVDFKIDSSGCHIDHCGLKEYLEALKDNRGQPILKRELSYDIAKSLATDLEKVFTALRNEFDGPNPPSPRNRRRRTLRRDRSSSAASTNSPRRPVLSSDGGSQMKETTPHKSELEDAIASFAATMWYLMDDRGADSPAAKPHSVLSFHRWTPWVGVPIAASLTIVVVLALRWGSHRLQQGSNAPIAGVPTPTAPALDTELFDLIMKHGSSYLAADERPKQTPPATAQLTLVASVDGFRPGSDRLALEDVRQLDALARQLRQSSAAIIVRGHTDSAPIRVSRWASNRDLAKARAEHVVQYLKKRGVDEDRFAVVTVTPEAQASLGIDRRSFAGPSAYPHRHTTERRVDILLCSPGSANQFAMSTVDQLATSTADQIAMGSALASSDALTSLAHSVAPFGPQTIAVSRIEVDGKSVYALRLGLHESSRCTLNFEGPADRATNFRLRALTAAGRASNSLVVMLRPDRAGVPELQGEQVVRSGDLVRLTGGPWHLELRDADPADFRPGGPILMLIEEGLSLDRVIRSLSRE